MKPVDSLTESDFRDHQIWEYCIDDELNEEIDETWVRPVSNKNIPANSMSLQVAATFRLNDNKNFKGFVEISTMPESAADEVKQPAAVIFEGNEQRFVAPKDSFLCEKGRQELARALNRKIEEIFPIKYRLLALVEGEDKARSGTID